jgi:hypothetical protein
MTRWIVTFRSHLEGPADVHCVCVQAPSVPRAIAEGIFELEGVLGEWVQASALPAPSTVSGILDAMKQTLGRTGTDA